MDTEIIQQTEKFEESEQKSRISKKWRKLSLMKMLTCIILVITILLVSILLMISAFMFLYRDDEDPSKEYFMYRLTRFDATDNTTTSSFTQIYDHLGANEFQSYHQDENVMVLISDFGSTEYKCTGSCICEKDGEARRFSLAVSKTLVTLVAALSSYMAYELAKKHFDDECKHSIAEENECLEGSIQSQIDVCEPLYSVTSEEEKQEEKGVRTKEGEDSERKDYQYECTGKCLKIDPKIFFNGMLPKGKDWNRKIFKGLIHDFKKEQKAFHKRQGMCGALSLTEQIRFYDVEPTLHKVKVSWMFSSFERFCSENGHSTNVYLSTMKQTLQYLSMCNSFELAYFDSQGIDRKTLDLNQLLSVDWEIDRLNPSVECIRIK